MRDFSSGWEVKKVKELAQLLRGITYKKEQARDSESHGYKPILRANNINGSLNFDSLVYIPEELIAEDQYIQKDDIIFAMSSGSKNLVGKSARAIHDFNGSYGAFCGLVRPNSDVYKPYLYYAFQESEFRSLINKVAKGSNINNLKREHILDFEISCPSIGEQKRIVAKIEELFSELDKGIESLKTARAQLKVYRQVLLKHAFEGKLTEQWRKENADKLETPEQLLTRIQQERQARYQQQLENWKTAVKVWEANGKEGKKPSKPIKPKCLVQVNENEISKDGSIPKEWCWTKLGNIALVGTGVTPLKSNSSFYDSGDIPWVTSGALNDSFVREPSSYVTVQALNETNLRLYPPHTLVVALYGEGKTRGKCSELLIEATTNQAIASIMLEGLSSELRNFIKWFLIKNYEDMRLFASGGVQPNLNLGIIEKMAVPICTLNEAKEVVSLLEQKFSEIDNLDSEMERQSKKCETLRQSILKKAFSGQLVSQDLTSELSNQIEPPTTSDNIISFPVALPGIAATDLQAGIIAMAYRLHEQTPDKLVHFGHVKAEKISHLVEAHLGLSLGRQPVKDAAGPNDYPHLKKVEHRARMANWFDVKQQANGQYTFIPKIGFNRLLEKTHQALDSRLSDVENLLKLMLPMTMRQAEILATVYAAWNNLLLTGKEPDDEEIVTEARENWHPSKLNIARDKFFMALSWMRKKAVVPSGRGYLVKEKI